MNQEIRLFYSLEQLPQAVDVIKELMGRCTVFTLTGTLGAGKTTLVRALLQACGVKDEHITSPTFTYVNVYHNQQGQTFYHFDLYRVSSLDEFCMMGFQEYLYAPHSFAFVEWPDSIMPLLKHKVCHINIEYHGEHQRELVCEIRE